MCYRAGEKLRNVKALNSRWLMCIKYFAVYWKFVIKSGSSQVSGGDDPEMSK